jgi:DNA mismatch repair protein MutL
VHNLFFNAPARAKFLKSVAPETRAVSEIVTGLALANPRVFVTLTSDGRSLLELPGADSASARVAQIWGGEQAGTLIAATHSEAGLDLHGLLQRPDAARPGVRRSYLFVNGRPFRASELLEAADRGYRTTIPERARPWLFLYLRVPGGDVDVNVHPTKAEVRFRDHGRVAGLIEDAVRSALDRPESSATFDSVAEQPRLTVREGPEPDGRRRAEADDQMALFMASVDAPADSTDAAPTGPLPDTGASRPRLWQVLNTYVLAESRDGLLVVDQHSAHERILFERLMDAFERGGEHGQRLLFPLTIRLTPPEVERVEELSGILARAGFEVGGFGGDTVIVHAVPNPHPYFDAERAFREMVQELTHGSELVRSARNQHERIAMTFACKGAIKAGQRLSREEMQELFDQLFATELPHHDVHGRPTVVRLSAAELARKFGRS